MAMKYRYFSLIVLALLAVACSAGPAAPTALPTAALPPTATPSLPTETAALPTPPPSTETMAPQATAPLDPTCVAPQTPVPLVAADFGAYPRAIQEYLNAGVSAQQLSEALYTAGVANLPTTVLAGDLSGDGKRDMAVSIYDPASSLVPPAGKLLVYVCQDGQYVLALDQPTPENAGGPHLYALQDLNADGRAELALSTATCGANTCFEALQILEWEGTALGNRLVGDSTDLPMPLVEVVGPDADGRYALQVSASGFGSVGAGPQRDVTRTWTFQADGQWRAGEDVLAPSNFRIHALHDADAAARKGEYAQALLLYQRVVSDTTLEEWANPAQERADLGAYARFRMVVIYTLQGQADFATSALAELKKAFPDSTPQYAYVEMAQAFWDASSGGDVAAGCAAARQVATARSEAILAPLGSETFGYANADYQVEQVCP